MWMGMYTQSSGSKRCVVLRWAFRPVSIYWPFEDILRDLITPLYNFVSTPSSGEG